MSEINAFEIFKDLCSGQKKYFKDLTADREKASKINFYYLNKLLSSQHPSCEMANKLQKSIDYDKIDKTMIIKIYYDAIKKTFIRYDKKNKENEEDQNIIKLIKDFYEVSSREANEYYQLIKNDNEKIKKIKKFYGKQ